MEANKSTPAVIEIANIIELRKKNRAEIDESVANAITALSASITIDTEDQDKYANNVLAKCNTTLSVIEEKRKAYTRPLDAWKEQEMGPENRLRAEMERVRKQRNEFAKRNAIAVEATKKEIEKKRVHDLHIETVKADLIKAIQLGITDRVANGEKTISEMLAKTTLDTIDQMGAKLNNLDPKLDEKLFNSFIDEFSAFDVTIITNEEIVDIKKRARAKFTYPEMSAIYVKIVKEKLEEWKKRIPARKEYLKDLKTADDQKRAELTASQDAEHRKQIDDIHATFYSNKQLIEQAAADTKKEAVINTDFNAQIATQGIEEQTGTRKKVIFRFADENELINDPLKAAEILHASMCHIFTDKDWLGVYKRDSKSNLVKKDPDTGLTIYGDGIQWFLDELAKIKPTPVVPGLIATEGITTIAKKK